MNKEQIIEAIKNMTVLELNELVKACEEEFGVSAAAPVAVAVRNSLTQLLPTLRKASRRLKQKLSRLSSKQLAQKSFLNNHAWRAQCSSQITATNRRRFSWADPYKITGSAANRSVFFFGCYYCSSQRPASVII